MGAPGHSPAVSASMAGLVALSVKSVIIWASIVEPALAAFSHTSGPFRNGVASRPVRRKVFRGCAELLTPGGKRLLWAMMSAGRPTAGKKIPGRGTGSAMSRNGAIS